MPYANPIVNGLSNDYSSESDITSGDDGLSEVSTTSEEEEPGDLTEESEMTDATTTADEEEEEDGEEDEESEDEKSALDEMEEELLKTLAILEKDMRVKNTKEGESALELVETNRQISFHGKWADELADVLNDAVDIQLMIDYAATEAEERKESRRIKEEHQKLLEEQDEYLVLRQKEILARKLEEYK